MFNNLRLVFDVVLRYVYAQLQCNHNESDRLCGIESSMIKKRGERRKTKNCSHFNESFTHTHNCNILVLVRRSHEKKIRTTNSIYYITVPVDLRLTVRHIILSSDVKVFENPTNTQI